MLNVNFCIPLYNRGNDIKLLLENLNDMNTYFMTINITLTVHIGDFNSTDVDLQYELKKYKMKINIYTLSGIFNICQALQYCADQVTNPTSIICLIDADTCFTIQSYDTIAHYIKNILKQNENFIDFMVAAQQANLTIKKTLSENGGGGILLIYNDDFKKTNGFYNSEYIKERGTHWGGHDTYYQTLFINFGLKMYRPINNDIYLRYHERNAQTNSWYDRKKFIHYMGPPCWPNNKKVVKSILDGITIYQLRN